MKHVVVVPLKVSTADRERIQFLTKVAGQLRNATLKTMVGRVEQLRRDSRWRELKDKKQSKARTEAYNELKKKYRVSEFDAIRVAQEHARDSAWIKDHLDGRIITSLGKEVWVPVNQWLHGKAGKPRFQKAGERTLLSGNDQRAGLRYKNGYIVHSTQAINQALKAGEPLGDKLLKIRVDWESMAKKRRAYYRDRESQIKKVSLVLDKGKIEAHLVYDCKPYRSKEKIARAKENLEKKVAFDLGPSSLAFVSVDKKQSGVIQPNKRMLSEIKKERAKRRRLERALDRSRRSNNPDAFRDNGAYIPGKKISVRSKNYVHLQERLRQTYLREREMVSLWHKEAAEEIVSYGLELTTEKDTVKSWQEGGYGKSITLLAPGALKEKVFHEAKVLREHHHLEASNTELDTYLTHLSQTCICGRRVKKELHERIHNCQNKDCLLFGTPLHRDKFSALLGLWTKELGTKTNSQGKIALEQKLGVKKLLNGTYHTQEHRTVTAQLCSINSAGSLDLNLGVASDSMDSATAGLGQVKTSSKKAKAHESFLSKSSRSPARDREERVVNFGAADIADTKKLGESSGV